MTVIYDTLQWRRARRAARSRDGNRCSVARLLGGECAGTLHVHHLRPVAEGGAPYDIDNLLTACSSHHPVLEALRRRLLDVTAPPVEDGPPRCRHRHPSAEARAQCEARLARRWAARRAA